MKEEFKNMNKKDAEQKTFARNNNHSFMSEKDLPPKERLDADKIIKNFEAFTSREKFKKMEPWLQDLFYKGGGHIINNVIESDNS